MKDAIIVGGGPTGLYAAWDLARHGYDVSVMEEHPVAGKPVHCTGILAPESFDEYPLPRTSILNNLKTVRFHSPSGQVIEYTTERVEAVVIDRIVFDQSLSRMACDQGVEIHLGRRVTRIVMGPKNVQVHCAGEPGPLLARACILATGANYALQRDLNLGFPPIFLNSAQVEIPTPCPGEVELHFGTGIAPRGFAWSVPLEKATGSYVRIGLACAGNTVPHFQRFFREVRRQWRIEAGPEIEPCQRMLPLFPIQRTFGDRLLVAGDAAGLAKPTTGGGIYYGIVSASIAASVMAEALRRDDLSANALRTYQSCWKDRLLEEIEAQLTLRLLMQRLSDQEIENIFDLWASDGIMPLIRKTVMFNQHRRLILAMARHPAMRKILFRKL